MLSRQHAVRDTASRASPKATVDVFINFKIGGEERGDKRKEGGNDER